MNADAARIPRYNLQFRVSLEELVYPTSARDKPVPPGFLDNGVGTRRIEEQESLFRQRSHKLRPHCPDDRWTMEILNHTGNNNQIKSLVERIEKLEEEKAAISNDIKEFFSEAKSNGFDVKILKKVLSLRKQEASQRAEEQALLSVYMDALGMLADTPLGKAAVAAAKKTKEAPQEDDDFDDFD